MNDEDWKKIIRDKISRKEYRKIKAFWQKTFSYLMSKIEKICKKWGFQIHSKKKENIEN